MVRKNLDFMDNPFEAGRNDTKEKLENESRPADSVIEPAADAGRIEHRAGTRREGSRGVYDKYGGQAGETDCGLADRGSNP